MFQVSPAKACRIVHRRRADAADLHGAMGQGIGHVDPARRYDNVLGRPAAQDGYVQRIAGSQMNIFN